MWKRWYIYKIIDVASISSGYEIFNCNINICVHKNIFIQLKMIKR